MAESVRLRGRAGAVTAGEKLTPARITLPNGNTISTEQPDVARILSAALKREVRLEKTERAGASNQETAEKYWLDMEGLEHRDTVTDFNLPEGTFFVPAKLRVDINCARCVMTTLAQGDLTKDPGILRTAAQHNQVNVGVCTRRCCKARKIQRGDSIRLE
jgi:hypothetical protein